MYLPKHFEHDDPADILDFIRAHAFGTLVTVDAGVPFASHIPFLLQEEGETLILRGHLARANPQWRQLEPGKQVLAMFQGAHAYVSPTWYEQAGVPTWNYTAVHAYGTVQVVHDAEWLHSLVEGLSHYYEGDSPSAWQPVYPDSMLKAIVGLEMTVTSLQVKFKLNQNRSVADQLGVVSALQGSERETDRQVAELMMARLHQRDEV